jgi:hypothetical protein
MNKTEIIEFIESMKNFIKGSAIDCIDELQHKENLMLIMKAELIIEELTQESIHLLKLKEGLEKYTRPIFPKHIIRLIDEILIKDKTERKNEGFEGFSDTENK